MNTADQKHGENKVCLIFECHNMHDTTKYSSRISLASTASFHDDNDDDDEFEETKSRFIHLSTGAIVTFVHLSVVKVFSLCHHRKTSLSKTETFLGKDSRTNRRGKENGSINNFYCCNPENFE